MTDAPDPSSANAGPHLQTVAVLVLAGLAALGWLTFAMLGQEACEAQPLPRLISPNGAWGARIVTRTCGSEATTEVFIQPLAQPENDALACRAVALRGTAEVDLAWTRFRSVNITHGRSQEDVISVVDQCFGLGVHARRTPE